MTSTEQRDLLWRKAMLLAERLYDLMPAIDPELAKEARSFFRKLAKRRREIGSSR